MFLSDTGSGDVENFITKKKNKMRSGYDGISNENLKCCFPDVEEHLSEAFKECLNNSTNPNCLNIAKLIALQKKSYFNNPEKYRPPSLLSSLSKIFEKLLCSRMTKFFYLK